MAFNKEIKKKTTQFVHNGKGDGVILTGFYIDKNQYLVILLFSANKKEKACLALLLYYAIKCIVRSCMLPVGVMSLALRRGDYLNCFVSSK